MLRRLRRQAGRGPGPYRQRAKRLIYADRFDAVYLMARDANIEAVDAVCDSLATDGLISEEGRYVYRLRRDFRRRTGLERERAVVACLRRRHGGGGDHTPDGEGADSPELPEQTHEPARRKPSNGRSARRRTPPREPVVR